jgi:phage head maturation protease
MKTYQSKVFNLKALDVDTEQRRVKVAIAELETIDRDGDVFEPTAFDKTIKERGPQGTNEIWHLLDHTAKSFSALSKFSELGREGKYIAGVSQYKNSFAWREVAWPLYEAGDITQHSVGFVTEKEQKAQSGSHNIISEASLWEGSAVLWGANFNTPTMQVVKSLMNLDDDRDITMAEKIEELTKRIKDGKYDEKADLLVIELKRLQYYFDTKNIAAIIKDEKTTEPEVTTTQPEVKTVDFAALLTNYITTKQSV